MAEQLGVRTGNPASRVAGKNAGEAGSGTVHAMTVDVEDYYHVAALSGVISRDQWSTLPSRVERNTELLLELFASHGVKATFFVLGVVAERHPDLIRRIADQGHEIASHGHSHQLIYNQDQKVFRSETAYAKGLIEDIIQKPVAGYRAASYSITGNSLWALDILAELGFSWDSSVFPIRHDRYGIPGTPRTPYKISTSNGQTLIEFPLATARIMGLTVPAAGGGYFRQFPYPVFRYLFGKASEGGLQPQMFYLHPWEIDPDQPRYQNASWLSRFRHYTNLDKCFDRLERLLTDFQFGTVTESYNACNLNRNILNSNNMLPLAS